MDRSFVLHQATYEWTVKTFNRIKKSLSLNIKLHGDFHLLEEGEIFVFNHFARIETFLPHYLIYQETGAFCRTIGAKKLFEGEGAFAKYLEKVGVIPNDYEDLLPLLVAEIIGGRKVIIFPEGSMVKDRKVMDKQGKFRIYSKEEKVNRKHHTGAAILACAVNTVKQAIVCAEQQGQWDFVDAWLDKLDIADRETLLFRVHKPTIIIPCNITFYPINGDNNFLTRQAKFLNKSLSSRVEEELTIESNFLLKNTDMDMRLGKAIEISSNQSWWEKKAQLFFSKNLQSINHFFTMEGIGRPWIKILQRTFRRSSEKVRDKYMEAIYRETTINLLHMASEILLRNFNEKRYTLELSQYYLCVYLAIKNIQLQGGVHLHRGLLNPLAYTGLVFSERDILREFFDSAVNAGLIELDQQQVLLKENLGQIYEPNTARINNSIQVYHNEMAPISQAVIAVDSALKEIDSLSEKTLSNHLCDDELRSYRWHHHYFNKSRFDAITQKETATQRGQPQLFLPKTDKKHLRGSEPKKSEIGLLMIHGFLASPAEMKPLADKFHAEDYPVYCVRMAGHGTSPADLRETSWQQWLSSVRIGCEVLKAYAEKIVLVGFSTGGIVSLLHASNYSEGIAAVIGINSPAKFRDKKMWLVPMMNKVDKVLGAFSAVDNLMSYRPNDSEHPDINYSSIPIKALHQLLKLNTELIPHLPLIKMPCLLIQSSEDPIIAKDSAEVLQQGLINSDVSMVTINSKRHGILYESTGSTHKVIFDYVRSLLAAPAIEHVAVKKGAEND